MSLQEWSDPKIADVYSSKAANPSVNWFEYEVNVPAMFALIPNDAHKVLDFGCGSGDVTAMLTKKYETVEGCDPSQAMLEIARKDYPNIMFFEWDAVKPLEEKNGYYDAVFSKLAIHFVEDLHPVADQLFAILRNGGSLVYSVPHPISTVRKINGASYWQQTPYPTEIGSYGIQVTMIHRSLHDYIEPFLRSGFTLTEVGEPQIPDEIARKNDVSESDMAIPKRVNFRFTKPAAVQA
jgi:SAM-dependent methyltransferase